MMLVISKMWGAGISVKKADSRSCSRNSSNLGGRGGGVMAMLSLIVYNPLTTVWGNGGGGVMAMFSLPVYNPLTPMWTYTYINFLSNFAATPHCYVLI